MRTKLIDRGNMTCRQTHERSRSCLPFSESSSRCESPSGFGERGATMNDPHVAALIYQVRHHEGVNYSRAVPLELEATAFRVAVKDGEARFEMQKHHASEHDARGLVEPYIGSWEFDACIEHGPGYFKLEFSRSEIIDRSPSEPVTGFTVGAGAASWSFHTSEPRVRLSPHGYPSPPDVAYGYEHPDVRTLVQRYEGYRKGKEQLPSFADRPARSAARRRNRAARTPTPGSCSPSDA